MTVGSSGSPRLKGSQSGTPFRVAAETVDITPAAPCELAGHAPAVRSRLIGDALEASLLLIDDGHQQVLLVACDLLYPGPALRTGLEAALSGRLPASHVVLGASHTHNAPATDQSKPLLGTVDPSYLDRVEASVTVAALQLADRMPVPAQMSACEVALDHSINRRLRRPRLFAERPLSWQVGMGPNPRGARDEVATVVVIGDQEAPTAVVWNYACHPTAFPDTQTVSPDFPGEVRRYLRGHFRNPRLPVLFFQGFSGDTRPPAKAKVRTGRELVRRVCLGPLFGDFEPAEYSAWSKSMGHAIVSATQDANAARIHGGIRAARHLYPRRCFVQGPSVGPDVAFQAVGIGDWCIIGASAELVVDFARSLRGRAGGRFVMPTGCLDTPVGYLPTQKMYAQGGYEAGGFCRAFGIQSLQPDAGDVAERALLKVQADLDGDATFASSPQARAISRG